MKLATVTDAADKDWPHHIEDIVLAPNGCLVLTYSSEAGKMVDGHIYAPGQWKEVNISDDGV